MRFGTDGIRGVFGLGINSDLAFRAGQGTAETLGKGKILLAMDTRTSSYELYHAAKAGLVAGGADTVLLGIMPSPAVSYLAKHMGAAGGIMITASHNPPEYNGIKVFGHGGQKASEEQEQKIDYFLSNPPKSTSKGKTLRLDASSLYLECLLAATGKLGGLKVICDCGNGALYHLAGEFFRAAGAEITTINCAPNGEKINQNCGALFPENLIVPTKNDFQIGFSFDGDGDRVGVTNRGKIISGDSILYNLSGIMDTNTVVGTVLSNSALEKKLSENNKQLLRTAVGDKYILRLMQENNYSLGGEQSGHYIIRPHGVTADGLLTAGLLSKHIASGNKLEELDLVPQRSVSRFASGGRLECSDIQDLIKRSEVRLEGIGRLVVRMSGTEPKIRLMVECSDSAIIDEILTEFDQHL